MQFFLIKSKILTILLAAFLSATMICVIWLNSDKASEFRVMVKELILKQLTNGRPLPPGKVVDVIYVLGGGESSLRPKYQIAAGLYKNQVANEVWILSRPGITRFSQEHGRNYTNDEWSFDKLKQFGVPGENIKTIKIEEGFFGTLSEAKHISKVLQQREYTSILLISQAYHTQRVYISFKKLLPSEDVSFYIQNSSDDQRLYAVMIELIKLKVYQLMLLL
jgi:uncharacterized SAM-binding protein YcdF (DUF218 family)